MRRPTNGVQFWQQGCDDAKAGISSQILDLTHVPNGWQRTMFERAYLNGYAWGQEQRALARSSASKEAK